MDQELESVENVFAVEKERTLLVSIILCISVWSGTLYAAFSSYHRAFINAESYSWGVTDCLIVKSNWGNSYKSVNKYNKKWNVVYNYTIKNVMNSSSIARYPDTYNLFTSSEMDELMNNYQIGQNVTCYVDSNDYSKVTLLRIKNADTKYDFLKKNLPFVIISGLIIGILIGTIFYWGEKQKLNN